jgi:hypothetical protein
VRAALAGGAILLAAWLTALTLGAFGGFESLPALKLGGGGNGKAAAVEPKAAGTVAGEVADAPSTPEPASRTGSDEGAGNGNPPAPAHKPVKGRGTTTAPGQTTTGTAPGNANGHSGTKTTGKPVTTPGKGNAGSNAGGNGNGLAKGHYK